MVKTFSVNSNNDIYIGEDGNLGISVDLQAIIFICENKAKTRLGEMIFEIKSGIPYLETIFSEPKNYEKFKFSLRTALENTEGVLKVIEISLEEIIDPNSPDEKRNVLSYTTTIVTRFGQGIVNGATAI